MELYYHQTDGGAEYYSTTYIECPNGHKEGTCEGAFLRTDGNEIDINLNKLHELGLKLVIR